MIATIDGVAYYTTARALTSAHCCRTRRSGCRRQKLVVIAGGDGKGRTLSLAAPVARHPARLSSSAAMPMRRSVLAHGAPSVPLLDAPTLEQAVGIASAHARLGDAVLLSPACASFDMFRNYMHRGEVFADAVRELSAEAGQPS